MGVVLSYTRPQLDQGNTCGGSSWYEMRACLNSARQSTGHCGDVLHMAINAEGDRFCSCGDPPPPAASAARRAASHRRMLYNIFKIVLYNTRKPICSAEHACIPTYALVTIVRYTRAHTDHDIYRYIQICVRISVCTHYNTDHAHIYYIHTRTCPQGTHAMHHAGGGRLVLGSWVTPCGTRLGIRKGENSAYAYPIS